MTTAAAAPPAETGAAFTELPIGAIVPSKTNPRTHFDDAYLAELAGSIREKGLIQPIIVRRLETMRAIMRAPEHAARNRETFEIVAGECRYRASKLAGLQAVPAIVRDYTDAQVLETQLEENIHRKDLTPLEEAVGYRRLIDSNPTKHSAETIATRIGMSVAYVWDRLKLHDLVPAAKQLLETARIGVGHAILISRLKPEQQARVIKPDDERGYGPRNDSGLWVSEHARLELDEEDDGKASKIARSPYDGFKPKSVRELDAWIQRHIRFDVEHAAKAAPLQFEQTARDVQHAAALPGRGKKVIAITHEYRVADDARDEHERTYGSESWERADGQAKSKTCDHSVLGVFVAGPGYGSTQQVCVARDKCRVHFAKVIAAREKNQKLRESGKGKAAAKREQRAETDYKAQEAAAEAKRKAWDAERATALAALAVRVARLKITPALVAMAIDRYQLTEIQKLIGKITATNMGAALALDVVLSAGTWNRAAFLQAVKPFKFTMPAAADAKAAPAKVKAGKKR